MKLLKTEPALFLGVLQSALALAVGLGLHLTAGQTGSVEAATATVLALIAAVSVRPFPVAALTGVTGPLVTLLVAFGVHGVSPGIVSTVNAAIVAVLALVLRGHVTPKAHPSQRLAG
jgi:hypothetical protein